MSLLPKPTGALANNNSQISFNQPTPSIPQGFDPQIIGLQGMQQEQAQDDFDHSDILIQKERLGYRPYSRYFGFISIGGLIFTIVHLSQWFPIMRALIGFLFLGLFVAGIIDCNKQSTYAGYISREYLVSLALTYGAALLVIFALMFFIVYI
jgi:hypothetical protein